MSVTNHLIMCIFIIFGSLRNTKQVTFCIKHICEYIALCDGDNLSDNLPIAVSFCLSKLDFQLVESLPPNTSLDWHKATQHDITKFRETLASLLNNVIVPTDPEALTCNVSCNSHNEILLSFFNEMTESITIAGWTSIPHKKLSRKKGMPGWHEYVMEYKDK